MIGWAYFIRIVQDASVSLSRRHPCPPERNVYLAPKIKSQKLFSRISLLVM